MGKDKSLGACPVRDTGLQPPHRILPSPFCLLSEVCEERGQIKEWFKFKIPDTGVFQGCHISLPPCTISPEV